MHDPFPRTGRFRRGYHPRQVDAFLNHVDVSLSGVFPPPTASEIRQAGFELVRHGYDTEAVDAALDALEETVHALQAAWGGRRGRPDPAGEVEFLRSELASPYMRRFPRARTLHRGYDIDDVDAFVDRVIAGLEGTASLAIDEVRQVEFRPRRGGYAEDAVDDMLDRVIEILLVLRRQPGVRSGGPEHPDG